MVFYVVIDCRDWSVRLCRSKAAVGRVLGVSLSTLRRRFSWDLDFWGDFVVRSGVVGEFQAKGFGFVRSKKV